MVSAATLSAFGNRHVVQLSLSERHAFAGQEKGEGPHPPTENGDASPALEKRIGVSLQRQTELRGELKSSKPSLERIQTANEIRTRKTARHRRSEAGPRVLVSRTHLPSKSQRKKASLWKVIGRVILSQIPPRNLLKHKRL